MPRSIHRRRFLTGFALIVSALALLSVGYLSLFSPTARLTQSPFPEGYEAARAGDWRLTADLARQRLKAIPKDPDALLLLARASAQLGREETALGIYRQLPDERLDGLDRVWLANRLLGEGNKPEVIGLLKRGMGTGTDTPELLDRLVRLLIEQDRLAEALPIAKSLSVRAGWEARGSVLLGQILQAISDPAGAATAYLKALDFDLAGTGITRQELSMKRARLLMQAGEFEQAKAALVSDSHEETRSNPERTAETAWMLSRILLNLGDRGRASEMLSQSESYRPDPILPDPAPYAGSASCAECHRPIYDAQQQSHHALTFGLKADLARLPATQQQTVDPVNPGVEYQIKSGNGALDLAVHREGESASATGEFGFGSGDRGLTVVGHDTGGRLREFRVSYYADKNGWDITTGHPRIPSSSDGKPTSLETYLGEILNEDEVRLCFQCHTTNARAAKERIQPTAADHAIGCETCHGPATTHIKAMRAAPTFADVAIARPRLAAGSETVKLCGRCHSPGKLEVLPQDPTSVRFQATTLTWSRCYQQSQGEFSCLTCHSPHRNAETDPGFYEQKCLECHTAAGAGKALVSPGLGTRKIDLPASVSRKPCPVNPTDSCVDCHMPVIKDALPHSRFTDHFIRIPAQKSQAK